MPAHLLIFQSFVLTFFVFHLNNEFAPYILPRVYSYTIAPSMPKLCPSLVRFFILYYQWLLRMNILVTQHIFLVKNKAEGWDKICKLLSFHFTLVKKYVLFMMCFFFMLCFIYQLDNFVFLDIDPIPIKKLCSYLHGKIHYRTLDNSLVNSQAIWNS